MATFVECSASFVIYRRDEKIYNHPVNLDLCTSIRKTSTKWYPDNIGLPSIYFEGCVVTLAYKDETTRDAEYIRILELGKPKVEIHHAVAV